MAVDANKGALIGRRIAWNTTTNYVARFIALGAGFLLTPFILRHLDTTTYGLWILVGSVVGYTALLDLGIAQAVVKYIAEYRATDEMDEAHHLAATALWLYSLLGLLLAVIAFAAAPLFPRIFPVPPEQTDLAVTVVRLSGLTAAIAIPGTITTSVLRGLHRYDLVNLVSTVGTLCVMAGTVAVLLLGGGLIGIVAVNLVMTALSQIPAVWFIHRTAPELRFGWRGARRRCVRTIVGYSSSFFVMNVAGRLENRTDEIVIGAFMSVGAVTPYSLARRLSEITEMLTDQFLKVMLPLASELHAQDDWGRLRLLYTTTSRLTLAIFLAIGCPVMILAPALLTLWVGPENAQYAYLVVILTLASLVGASQWPAATILQGIARHRLPALTALAAGLLNLALSIFLLPRFGLAGVALGTLIPAALESLGFMLPYAMRTLHVSLRDLVGQVYLPTLLPLIPTLIVLSLLSQAIETPSLLTVGAAGAAGVLTYAGCYLLLGSSSIERHAYRDVASTAFRFVEARLRSQ
ncbi:MAG: oligosaccharide flippase family protein [Anaerolineae bacterium]